MHKDGTVVKDNKKIENKHSYYKNSVQSERKN